MIVYLPQHDEPLVVSQPEPDLQLSAHLGEFGSLTTWLFIAGDAGAGGEVNNSLAAIIPMAARITIVKMIFGQMLFFFGGQQFPSQPQSFFSWSVFS
ncbi:MAG TPA: hypothetical protein PKN44_13325 [Bacteroidales bacterium]|nr:hypothetical protein [Bacteroidales bacterium]